MGARTGTVSDGVSLRRMTTEDLPAAELLSGQVRWPHRSADWAQALRLAEGWVAERDGEAVGTGLRFDWGPAHSSIGLVIVSPICQGRRIGTRLMNRLIEARPHASFVLHATADGRGLYERLGFVRRGEIRQHQGIAESAPLIALPRGWRLRPASQSDLLALQTLDRQASGMPREALMDDLWTQADATVVLIEGDVPRGFAMLRRFGRGHVIGPVVAPDVTGAKALIAHLSGLNAGRFTRIDFDFDKGLGEWIEQLGLMRVDAPTTMLRGPALSTSPDVCLFALATQALG